MGFLFYFSSVPASELPVFDIPNIDKLFHFIEYFVLGALLVRALSNTSVNLKYAHIFIISVAIASFYGVTDELHQYFVSGRTSDIFDLLSDIIGAFAGAGLYIYKERIRRAVDKTV